MKNQFEFDLAGVHYRITRVDTLNLAIQKRSRARWKTVSYHGSSFTSLAHGLQALIARHAVPNPNDSLAEQINWLIDSVEKNGQAILAALSSDLGAGGDE